jgi:hypothetical protein
MSKKQQVMKLAEELHVEVYRDDRKAVCLEAPDGYWFYASGCHGCVASIFEEDAMTLAWSMALKDLRDGLVPCTAHDPSDWDCLPATEVVRTRTEPW